jgi:hypothetical protein
MQPPAQQQPPNPAEGLLRKRASLEVGREGLALGCDADAQEPAKRAKTSELM